LLRHAWIQNWDDELGRAMIRWRFYERPDGHTLVACDDDVCVGMLDVMVRPSLLRGQQTTVYENGDWFCLPKYRAGVGFSLLRRTMRETEPQIVIGGSEDTMAILPRVNFRIISTGRYYIRPLTLRGLAGNLLRRKFWQQERLAHIVPAIHWRMMQSHCPAGGMVRMMQREEEIPLPNGDGLVQMIEPWHWQWLLQMPRKMASPVGLVFSVSGKIVGCVICQLEPTAADLDGRILHLQFANMDIGHWAVTTTVNFLRECGVGFIRCCATTQAKYAALEAAGFIQSKQVNVYWYSRKIPPPINVDAGYLRGDDGMPFHALRGRRLAEYA
jgi:hypothetical protein